MRIEVLGPGCWKCKALEENVRKALQDLGIDAKIEKVTDISKIIERVAMTPAIAINGNIMAEGRVPGASEIRAWLEKGG